MQYTLLIYSSDDAWAALSEEERTKLHEDYGTLTQELIAAGVLQGGEALQSVTTATSVRLRDGQTLTTDGPFAETKEHLVGFYLVDVPTLDDALGWAAKIPSATFGTIEVRPVMPVGAEASA